MRNDGSRCEDRTICDFGRGVTRRRAGREEHALRVRLEAVPKTERSGQDEQDFSGSTKVKNR
jgi:hypothetical protein